VQEPENLHQSRPSETYEYDPAVQTHLTKVTDNVGYSSSATYNLKYGQVESQIDLNNNRTTYVYDKFGRVVSVAGPYEQGGATPTIRFEYHPEALVPWALTRHFDPLRDPSGADTIDTVRFVDGLQRVLQTKKDAAVHTGPNSLADEGKMVVSGRVTFDLVGRTVERFYPVTEPLGSAGVFHDQPDPVAPTSTEFDILNRPTKVTMPDPTIFIRSSFGFGTDRDGTLQFETTVTDENGVQKQTYRDVRELMTSLKELNKGGSEVIWTSYAYDPMKQLVQVKDDEGHLTKLGYDNLGRRTIIENPDTGRTEVVYDLASNITAKITARLKAQNAKVVYDYDALNRLKTIGYPNFPANNVTYTYGAPGAADNRAARIALVQDQSGSEERFYGKLGELTREVKTVVGFTGAPPNTYTTQYVHDTLGRLRTLTYPDGEVLTYQYDAGGQVKQATGLKGPNGYAYVKRMEYDKFEQRVFVEAGNGVRSQYDYDAKTRRLQNLRAAGPDGAPFQNLAYGYDKVGNVLSLSNNVAVPAPSQFGGPTSQIFEYDDLYRLTSARGAFQFAPDKTNQYTLGLSYDTIHRTLSKTQTNDVVQPSAATIPQHKTTYAFAYAYQGPRPHAVAHVDNRTFSYDANGNQTGWANDLNGTSRTIVWDDENRVQSIFDNGHEKSYKYDDKGERVVKRGQQGETAYVNQYFTIRNGAIGTKQIYAGDTRLVSKLMKKDPSVVEKDQYFYHPDHLGSSNYITDANGARYEHLEYFPFGETWVQESSNTQRTPYLFTGKELDEETDLYYYSARYYDPRTSQFISTDPLLHSDPHKTSASPAVLNLYAYVGNNPLRFIDPTGTTITLAGGDAFKTERKNILGGLQELTSDTLGLQQRADGKYDVVIQQASQTSALSVGTRLVASLIKSDKTTTIEEGGASATKPALDEKGASRPAVTWSRSNTDEYLTSEPDPLYIGLQTSSQAEKAPAYIALGHELIHAWRVINGRVAPEKIVEHRFRDHNGRFVTEKARAEELIVVGILRNPNKVGIKGDYTSSITEAKIRAEHRLAPRTAYVTKSQAEELKN
jgi:RHS repeat-associated protein